MKILKENIFTGDLYKCTSFPTVACTFLGVVYEEKKVSENQKFIKLPNESFVEINDLLSNGKNATRYLSKAKSNGDIFVKNLKQYTEEKGKISIKKLNKEILSEDLEK